MTCEYFTACKYGYNTRFSLVGNTPTNSRNNANVTGSCYLLSTRR